MSLECIRTFEIQLNSIRTLGQKIGTLLYECVCIEQTTVVRDSDGLIVVA